jgi:hypothetical protein
MGLLVEGSPTSGLFVEGDPRIGISLVLTLYFRESLFWNTCGEEEIFPGRRGSARGRIKIS